MIKEASPIAEKALIMRGVYRKVIDLNVMYIHTCLIVGAYYHDL
jgi:hypothetical protein